MTRDDPAATPRGTGRDTRPRISAQQARQGRIVLRRPWQRWLVLGITPALVVAIVVVGLAIGV